MVRDILLLGSASVFAMLLSDSAVAQTAQTTAPTDVAAQTTTESESGGDIVVTGSRITAAGFDAPTPTTTLSAEMIKQTAQPNLFNTLTQLPALQGSTGTANNSQNANTSVGDNGLSALNMRGLGTIRTLTLLDVQILPEDGRTGCAWGTNMFGIQSSDSTLGYVASRRILLIAGLVSIAVSILTWALDLTQVTYACPFCRVQRSAIGLLGIALLLVPHANRFLLRYLSVAVAVVGLGVATMQNFNGGWMRMFKGTFAFHNPVWFDPTILSACAILIMSFQLGAIFEASARQSIR